MAKKNISYDEAINELDQIVAEMEDENIGIDDLSARVKRATELIGICRQKLSSTEEEVNKILNTATEDSKE
ncbi:MAG: exodeoxyribonuclease VII small subunit [Marinilabiliales bacterium]|nr:MAG: exodeoxyribonuclease VII small subunit [Marinilabiliales bacterium]